jgi:hypothetical protein
MSGRSTPRYVCHQVNTLKEVTRDSNAEDYIDNYSYDLQAIAITNLSTSKNRSKNEINYSTSSHFVLSLSKISRSKRICGMP